MIGERDKDSKEVEKPSESSMDIPMDEAQVEPKEWANAEHESVPIRFNKVMARYGRGVNVVLTKWTNEGWAITRKGHWPVSVSSKVNQSERKSRNQ